MECHGRRNYAPSSGNNFSSETTTAERQVPREWQTVQHRLEGERKGERAGNDAERDTERSREEERDLRE